MNKDICSVKQVTNYKQLLKLFFFIPLYFITSCSSFIVLNPQGKIGTDERTIIIIAAILMLIVVLPAIAMTFLFAWKYRKSNEESEYKSQWTFSRTIEITIWVVPAIIISILSIIVWVGAHRLDQYHPIKSQNDPIVIQVVSLDWKWLFIYPEYGIATVNSLAFPVNVPIHFYLTSDTVINAFFIPQLGSQMMTMAGMKTQLYLIANKTGSYYGFSSNFSGEGFSKMHFQALVMSKESFGHWVAQVKINAQKNLDAKTYEQLAKSTINHPIQYFLLKDTRLFQIILKKYQHNLSDKQGKDKQVLTRYKND